MFHDYQSSKGLNKYRLDDFPQLKKYVHIVKLNAFKLKPSFELKHNSDSLLQQVKSRIQNQHLFIIQLIGASQH